MSVVNGQDVEASIVNSAFMSRNSDTSTTGKVSLENVDSQNVDDVQKLLEDVQTVIGITENDPNLLDYATGNFIGQENIKTNISNLDQALQTVSDALDDLNVRENDNNSLQAGQILDLQNDIIEITSQDSSFGGNKTFTGNVVVQGDLTVNGSEVIINTTQLTVEDPLITLNKNGDDVSAELGGIEIERTTDNAVMLFDPLLESKWKVGTQASNSEVITSAYDQDITGLKSFVNGLETSVIEERVLDAGVTVDGVELKDGLVNGRDVVADATTFSGHIADTNNPHAVTASQVGLGNVTNDAQLTRANGDFDLFASKSTPIGTDIVLIEDSEDSFSKKKVALSDIGISGGGGSGFGGRNYLAENGVSWDGEDGITNWNLYQSAATSRPSDLNPGTPSVVISTNTFFPITGDNSLILEKPSGNYQGEGYFANFIIDDANRARRQTIEFDYRVYNGSFTPGTSSVDSDLIVYIRHNDTNTFIEPTNFKLVSDSTDLVAKFKADFQTLPTGTSYALVFHVATTSTSDWQVQIDNVVVKPSESVSGNIQTDWQDVSSLASLSNSGNATLILRERRVGDSAEYTARITIGSTLPTGTIIVNLPRTADSSKITANTDVVGVASANQAGGYSIGSVRLASDFSRVLAVGDDNAAVWNATTPVTFAAGNQVFLDFKVPIQGWSSSVQMSSEVVWVDDVGKVDAFAIPHTSPPQGYLFCNGAAVSRSVYAELFQKIGTRHGSGDGSTTFNLPDYRGRFLRGQDTGIARDPDRASRTAMNTGGNTGDNVGSVQGHEFASHTHIQNAHNHDAPSGFVNAFGTGSSGTRGNYSGSSNSTRDLTGSTIATNQNTGGNETRPLNAYVNYFIKFTRHAAPILAQSEVVSVSAGNASGLNLGIGGGVNITNWTKSEDTHNAFNATTGIFTAPFSALYEFTMTLSLTNQPWSIGNVLDLYFQNQASTLVAIKSINVTLANQEWVTSDLFLTIRLNAGQTIRPLAATFGGSGARNLVTATTRNTLYIKSVR